MKDENKKAIEESKRAVEFLEKLAVTKPSEKATAEQALVNSKALIEKLTAADP